MAKNTVTYWNRLEGSSYHEDDTSPYEFRLRDPLWMLSRQWQMGEFEAEDNGSPIDVECNFRSQTVAGIKGSNDTHYMGINLDTFPLESEVESIFESQYSLQDAYQAGQMLLEIIDRELSTTQAKMLKKKLIGDASKWLINPDTFVDDPQLDQYYALLLRKNQLDGVRLFKDARTLRLKAGVSFSTTTVDKVWGERIEAVMPFITGTSKYWKEEQLEYEFDVATSKTAKGYGEFKARNYHNGSVDWFNFDFDKENRTALIKKPVSQPGTSSLMKRNVIPKGISFPGMPGVGLWEIDDPSANLLNLSPEKTELLKVVLTDFVLNYGNDWFDFPLTIENGRNTTISHLVVKDVFGQTTRIYPDKNAKSHFFSNGYAMNDSLFLLSTNTRKEMGKPLEKITFARDEVSNLVFGIEEIVPNGMGHGRPAMHKKRVTKKVDLQSKDGGTDYKLKTEFEHNWIPFIIKEKSGRVLLQRAAQIVPDPETETLERIRPKSILLRNGINNNDEQTMPYFIREEEVPKAGIVVQTLYQRTRWFDGRVVTWLGREKSTGQGERNGNLNFDKLT